MLKTHSKIVAVFCFWSFTLFAQINVDNVIDDYFKAIGGVDLLKQVTTFSSVSVTNLNGEHIELKTKQKFPNLKLMEIYKNDVLISKKVFNGKKGYKLTKGVKKKYTEEEIVNEKKLSAVFPEFGFLNTAVYVGEAHVSGKLCHVLSFENKKMYYDSLSGLKLKAVTVFKKDTKEIIQETYYSDYKKVKGILFPLTYLIKVKDMEILYTVESISLNRDVILSDFE
ncbi:hypothetical protein Q4595_01365 [Wenyingzhuangia sp. 1_MG-2023]|nr:hypothetical protein [Wenyingzhuangia sp. 1_MG-2023]